MAAWVQKIGAMIWLEWPHGYSWKAYGHCEKNIYPLNKQTGPRKWKNAFLKKHK